MNNKISFEELLIEFLPFSNELKGWCKFHPEFMTALKNIHYEKFVSLGAILTSFSPNYPKDEVIGIYVYDYSRKFPMFKQDFIVNKGKLNNEFILFTRNPKNLSSKYVRDISEFYLTYGKGGNYINSHHLSFDELPEELKPRGLEAISLANKLKSSSLTKPSQEHISKIYEEVESLKRKIWVEKTKLSH